MTLVDTSVWVDHLRAGEPGLVELLDTDRVWTHPFVIGELACGNLGDRQTVLRLLSELPAAPMANDEEVRFFIGRHRLMGRGIGYIDTHLLASVSLTGSGSARRWSRDQHLVTLAETLGLAVGPP